MDYLLAAAICINGGWAVLNMANTASNVRLAQQLGYAARALQLLLAMAARR